MKHRQIRYYNITVMAMIVTLFTGFYLTSIVLFGITVYGNIKDGAFKHI